MESTNGPYGSADLAILIPTKERPQKIRNLLNSIAAQSVGCGRIIVVDGGQSVRDIVLGFSDCLPVEYYEVSPPGQIRQRNMAISLLNNLTRLVVLFDDDIELEQDAIKAMLHFWNTCDPETAGVSFNIVNNPPFRHTWWKAITGMSASKMGRILPSGYNVAISPVNANIRTQWLCGGATVWKREILNIFVSREVIAKWAICEDIIFSYPIGKVYPLYVCAASKVRHEHVYDHATKMKYWFYGKTVTLWRLYFVKSNPELSPLCFFWMISWQVIIRFLMGLCFFRLQEFQYAFGQIEGAIIGIKALFQGKDLLPLLND